DEPEGGNATGGCGRASGGSSTGERTEQRSKPTGDVRPGPGGAREGTQRAAELRRAGPGCGSLLSDSAIRSGDRIPFESESAQTDRLSHGRVARHGEPRRRTLRSG